MPPTDGVTPATTAAGVFSDGDYARKGTEGVPTVVARSAQDASVVVPLSFTVVSPV